MIDIGFFYLVLILILLVLLFIIVLYTGGHSRIIAPPVMNSFYGVSTSVADIDTTWRELELVDGDNSLTLDSGKASFEFTPLSSDRNRKLSGKMLMYAQSQGTSIWFNLRMKDRANDKVIADPTRFVLQEGTSLGLQQIQLVFDAPNVDNSHHDFYLEAQALSPTTSFPGTSMLINSAYFAYI